MLKKIFYITLIILIGSNAAAQKNFQLEIILQQKVKKNHIPEYDKKFTSYQERQKAIDFFIRNMQANGYLEAETDSITGDSLFQKVYITPGKQYRWATIRAGNVNETFLNRSGYREKLYWHEPLRFDRISQMQKKILKQYENNGYPFASIQLDSVTINEGEVTATLNADPGQKILIDSITTSGKGRIAPGYLYSYLGIKPGKPYNEASVRTIESRLKGLPFITPMDKPRVEFYDDKATIRLNLDKQNANQFYGILGIVPASDLNGGVLITGDIKLRLQNLLHRGELLDVQWQRLQAATQQLNIQAQYPYLLNTPIGLDGKFDFFRIDSAFYTINAKASVMYMLQGVDYIRFTYNFQTSRKVLPEDGQSTIAGLANTDIHYYGLGFQRERLDYRFNPRKGYKIQFDGAVGVKKIYATPQDTVNPVDSIAVGNSIQGNLTAVAEGYIPIWKRFTIKIAARAGWQISPYLFRNELFRIGGLLTLRGFDESSIYNSFYSIGTFEFRFLIDQGSYVSLFSDAGYYERAIRNEYYSSYVVGFGAGITFATKIGLFTLNYALGTQKDSPIDFKRSKIHFGYINYF